jgi:uncharacterized phage-associated protein
VPGLVQFSEQKVKSNGFGVNLINLSSTKKITVVSRLQRFYTGFPQVHASVLSSMSMIFDESKATQVAAAVIRKRGGRIHYLKLIKLLYLIDREALLRWGVPVTTDRYVSMDHGPVLSNIYRLIVEDKPKPVWAKYISQPLGDYEVELLSNEPATDRLSRAEESLIAEIYDQYGYRNRWDLVENVMHKLPEWTDPHGSSISINIRQILEAQGENPEEITAVLRELRAIESAEEALSYSAIF